MDAEPDTVSCLQNWIEIDEEYEDDIALRRQLLAEQRDVVIRSLPEVRTLPSCSVPESTAKMTAQES